MTQQELNSLIVSSRVRLARNIEGLPFRTAKPNVFVPLAEIIKSKNRGYISTMVCDLGEEMARALFEQHLVSKELLQNRVNSMIVVKNDNKVCIMLGEEDHIRIQSLRTGFDLQTAFDEAKKIADDLAASSQIAFRPDFGYLTSCPTNLGCAMRASVMMFLPALTMTDQIEDTVASLGGRITVRGVYGEGSKAGGYMYQISNQSCLGLAEQRILENVSAAAIQIAKQELALQRQMFANEPDELTDQVYRAWGVLTNAYMLSSAEAVENLALLKLGSCLGIVKFKNERILDELFFIIQPNTMTTADTKAASVAARDKLRAARIAEVLRTTRIK